MSGVEFFRHLKRWYPDTVRLVLSGYTELKSVTDAINEGAVYKFITKPWEDDQLRATIQEAFERFELKRNNDRLDREAGGNQRTIAANPASSGEQGPRTGRHQRAPSPCAECFPELLEYLPVGVVGVDEDGILVAHPAARARRHTLRHPSRLRLFRV